MLTARRAAVGLTFLQFDPAIEIVRIEPHHLADADVWEAVTRHQLVEAEA
jgi:hypothetical protein